MNKHLKTVDWFILVTAALDILVFLLILLVPSCNRSEPRFVQPEAEIVDSDEDVSQAMTVGESGQLKITLLWDFPGDIDLHVEQPNGREIYYKITALADQTRLRISIGVPRFLATTRFFSSIIRRQRQAMLLNLESAG